MGKFALIRTLKLDHYGEGWEDCFLKFREPTAPELAVIQELSTEENTFVESAKKMMEVYQNCLIEGKMFDGKEAVEVKKEDLNVDDVPFSIITDISSFLLTGQVLQAASQENKKKPS